jgi:dTDP-L-rhamnose 4-epimerase
MTHSSKVLITGGLGFIGQVLTQNLLDHRHQVVVMDSLNSQIHGPIPDARSYIAASSGLTILRGDVTRRADLAEALAHAEVVIHLAAETGTAQSMYEISRYNQINSQGTAELLDLLANTPHRVRKVVLASSRSVYGEGAYHCPSCGMVSPLTRSAGQLDRGEWDPLCPDCAGPLTCIPTPETSRVRPASIYAATKLAQEDLVRIACTASGLPFTLLRFQNVYGRGQSLNNPYTGILSIFSTRIRRGMDLPIFEDGKESRDFVHVRDVAEAIRLTLDHPETDGGIFNVGSGVPTSVQDVADMLIKAFKGRSKTYVTGQYRVGDIRHCFADMTALRTAAGFAAGIPLEEGLADFAAWVGGQSLPEDGLDHANKVLIDRGLMK